MRLHTGACMSGTGQRRQWHLSYLLLKLFLNFIQYSGGYLVLRDLEFSWRRNLNSTCLEIRSSLLCPPNAGVEVEVAFGFGFGFGRFGFGFVFVFSYFCFCSFPFSFLIAIALPACDMPLSLPPPPRHLLFILLPGLINQNQCLTSHLRTIQCLGVRRG